jgi:hypothetical protein
MEKVSRACSNHRRVLAFMLETARYLGLLVHFYPKVLTLEFSNSQWMVVINTLPFYSTKFQVLKGALQ